MLYYGSKIKVLTRGEETSVVRTKGNETIIVRNENLVEELNHGVKHIYNATLHEPSEGMVKWGKENKILFSEQKGVNITSEEDLNLLAEEMVLKASSLGYKAILVGGLTSMGFYITSHAHMLGMEVYEAITKRVRDENDRFVFNFKGLRKINRPYQRPIT